MDENERARRTRERFGVPPDESPDWDVADDCFLLMEVRLDTTTEEEAIALRQEALGRLLGWADGATSEEVTALAVTLGFQSPD